MIYIDPPLSHAEVRQYNEWLNAATTGAKNKYKRNRDVEAVVSTTEEDTDAGTVITKSASMIIPNNEGQLYSRSNTLGDLAELLELFSGHTFTGYIEVEGEGYGDEHEIVRYVATDLGVGIREPIVTWPDE